MCNLVNKFTQQYDGYLKDESKLSGSAESISFPKSTKEISEIVKDMKEKGIPITIQGSRTGIMGGAVPKGGHIINMSYMNKIKTFREIDGENILTVESGITLLELNKEINQLTINSNSQLFWPPNPTEQSATIGGIVACDAKGLCRYDNASTKSFVHGITVVLADGSIKNIVRGKEFIKVEKKVTDIIDVFLGSEGILGVITEVKLKLLNKPKEEWGIVFFFENTTEAFSFIESLSSIKAKYKDLIHTTDYMDKNSINLAESRKDTCTKIKELPQIDEKYDCIVYVEIHSDIEEEIEKIAEVLMETAIEHNSDPDVAWAMTGETEMQKLRDFRHCIAESINLLLDIYKIEDPAITKLVADIKIEGKTFGEVIEMCSGDLEENNLNYCIFGNCSSGTPHINIITKTANELHIGKNLIDKWNNTAYQSGCEFISEYGIGKLNRELFTRFSDQNKINEVKKIKKLYDVNYLFNPENIII